MLKKTIALLLCLCLLPALAACGAEEAGSDPNAGLYEAATAEMLGIEVDISDMYEKGFSIELKDKGKCAFNIDGQKGSGKWTLYASFGQPDPRTEALTGKKAVSCVIE